jgi:prepilin-type N-terminal cleavage/methylation domain-containing protein
MMLTRSNARSRDAFTLIELMVVVVVIGIVSAVIIPEMRGTFEEAVLKATARQFTGACNLAYSRAVSLQRPHRLVINSGKKNYTIEQKGGEAPGFSKLKDVAGSEREIDSRITVQVRDSSEDVRDEPEPGAPPAVEAPPGEGGSEAIIFNPDGTADEREIVLRDRDGFKMTLRINPVTGRVELVEPKAE